MKAVNDFEAFVRDAEPRLRRALIAAYGSERGREATAEALAYGWEHWARVRAMQNPTGYLYRVGQSRTRRRSSLRTAFPVAAEPDLPNVEPGLGAALAALTERQRIAVVLVHGFGWTLREVADLTGRKVPTVQRHAERGLAKLRAQIGGVEDECT